MRRKQMVFALAAAMASIATPALSQDEEGYRNEVVGQGFGSFVKTTTDQGVRQSATDSGGVLGSYRYFFGRHHGVEGTYGYSQNTHQYFLTSNTVGVKARSHEISGAYVLRFPSKVITPFILGGAGTLMFDPRDAPSLDPQYRLAFIYGGGTDINLSWRIYLRAQFRGLIYNTPTWDMPSLVNLDRWSHRAEPSAGIGFRF